MINNRTGVTLLFYTAYDINDGMSIKFIWEVNIFGDHIFR